ncbi:sensor domain-containing diguanylate cyclase [Altererythrobacter sp. CAU 1778]
MDAYASETSKGMLWLQASGRLGLLLVGLSTIAAGTCVFLAEGAVRYVAVGFLLLQILVLLNATAAYGLATRAFTATFKQRSMAQDSHAQVQELFAMTDMLQAAESYSDAGAVLNAAAARLLPDCGGAFYVFNNSRDRLDLSHSWNYPEGHRPPESLSPDQCWALKRGKPHLNSPIAETLCCMHHGTGIAASEIPMIARGKVHGLLIVAMEDSAKATQKLQETHRTARALADSISLAIANIALREKLQTQSLRDPLTGLYNRRYMEDSLHRYSELTKRGGPSLSAIMMDLDNFKRLNDEEGHARGDAVLAAVASSIVSNVRPSDIVCRYGGEEFLILLPDSDLKAGRDLAERLRLQTEQLGAAYDCKISASFGVSSMPETVLEKNELIEQADKALYHAKRNGKNRVEIAQTSDHPSGRDPETTPRLAAAN